MCRLNKAVETTRSDLAGIHDPVPVILAPAITPAGSATNLIRVDLMRPFPSELMRMWAISTRVNKPENDDPSIVKPIELRNDAA